MMNRALFSIVVAGATVYVCPMHPDVISSAPGLCPKCHMRLDPKPGVSGVRPADTTEVALRP